MRCGAALALLAGCQFSPSAAVAIDAPARGSSIDAPDRVADAPAPADAGFEIPAVVQAQNPEFSQDSHVKITFGLTAGDLLVAATYTSDLGDTLTVTDTGGLAWTAAAAVGEQQSDEGCAPRLQIWYAPVVTSATDTVTLAQNNTNALGMALVEYSGLATASPVDQAGGATAATNTSVADPGPITTTDRDVIVALFGDLQGGGTMTAGSGLIARGVDPGFYSMYGDDVPGVPPGQYDLTAALAPDANDNCWTAEVLALRVAAE